jgi:hypothetical protein
MKRHRLAIAGEVPHRSQKRADSAGVRRANPLGHRGMVDRRRRDFDHG